MFKQINQWLRTAATLGATAAALVACGGGEGLPLTKIDDPEQNACTATSDCAVSVKTATAFQYGTGAADGAVAANANDYTITGKRTDLTEAWGAVVGQLKLSAAKDVSAYKSLKLSLASSSNNEVTLMLVSSDAKQDCYPTYKVTGLSATAKNFTIALSDFKLANNPNPALCAPDKTTDPDTVAALKKVTEIQVREIKSAAGKNTVNAVVGKPLMWSTELPVVPPTVTAVSVGYIYAVGFGGAGDTAHASKTFTGGTTGPWDLKGTRITGAESYSTVQGVLGIGAQPAGAMAKTSLGFTLTSSGNPQILIRLKSSAYTDGCTPSYVATGLTGTAKAFTVALSDFKAANDLSGNGAPTYAPCDATTNPGTALDLANFDKIEITDRKETTGGTTINVTLSSLNWVVAP